MDVYNAIASFISKMGFPIFVATFLLLRVDKTLRENLVLLRELATAVKVLASLEGDNGDDEDEGEEPEREGEEAVTT